jgi:rubredoxin
MVIYTMRPILCEPSVAWPSPFPIQPEGKTVAKTWMCLICGWIYDESTGAPEHGIAPGTPWDQVPMNWTCPECGARKEDFEMVEI